MIIGAALSFRFPTGVKVVACTEHGDLSYLERYTDLPYGIWVTDIPVNDFFIMPSVARTHLRHREYLGEDINVIFEHYMMPSPASVFRIDDSKKYAQILARIVGRFFALGRKIGIRDESGFNYFYEALQPLLLADDGDEAASSQIEIAQSGAEILLQDKMSYIANAGVIVADETPEECPITVRTSSMRGLIDPFGALNQISSAFVPLGAWHEVPVTEFGDNVVDQVRAIALLSQPVLVRVRIADIHDELSCITRNALRSGAKRWVSHPEFIFLRYFATQIPERVFVCERYVKNASLISRPLGELPVTWHSSITATLMTSSLCQALSKPWVCSGIHLATSRVAWTASVLRMEVLKKIIQAGWGSVTQFNRMNVFWSCPEEDRISLAKRAREAGFIVFDQ